MRTPQAANDELVCPARFIEIHGPSFAEEKQAILVAYFEHKDHLLLTLMV